MISIGTCSWTEKTLIQSGEFYPGEVKTAEGRLRYYADHFNTVEVDATYYAIPDRKNTSLWAERTPEDFIFHIKAYGAFTGHRIDPKTLPKDMHALLPEKDKSAKYVYTKEPSLLSLMAERFRDSLTPLIQAKKLGVLVFQFPPWFQYRKTNFDSILKCRELMQGLPIGVEFRHGSWLAPEVQQSVFQFLEETGLTYIAADEPQYGSLATVPFIPRTTSDIAYFRFHGRNKETWLKKGVETALRYSYLYSDQELREFVPPLRSAGKKAKITYAMFNNCHGGFAMRNALRLKELTGQKTQ